MVHIRERVLSSYLTPLLSCLCSQVEGGGAGGVVGVVVGGGWGVVDSKMHHGWCSLTGTSSWCVHRAVWASKISKK